jgi:two-component system, chemotaxis family, chemotaxis protein CheY
MAKDLETLRVLIVEDKQHMRQLLRALLSSAGVRDIYEVPDGEAGLAFLKDRRCDLILLDLGMAPMDGLEFTRRVRTDRKFNWAVPIIVISGYTERERVEAARDAGATEFLAKPITAQNLFARIGQILESPRRFVRTKGYNGPDRRRKSRTVYGGPLRRRDDFDDLEMVSSKAKTDTEG